MNKLAFVSLVLFFVLLGGLLSAGGTLAEAPSQPAIGAIIKDCADCPEMVTIPQVGHSAYAPGNVFYVGRYEITWKEYIRAIDANYCPPLHIYDSKKEDFPPTYSYYSIADNYPLTLVSPNEFKCYLNWLKYKTGHTYRLPSREEWEHLARAGAKTKYPWGNDLGFDHAAVTEQPDERTLTRHYDRQRLVDRYKIDRLGALNSSDMRRILQSDDIWPVGSFAPNAWGIFDVIGNADEAGSAPSSACASWQSKKGPCPFIETYGPGSLPKEKFRNSEFSLVNFPGFTVASGRSGTVGFRIVRD